MFADGLSGDERELAERAAATALALRRATVELAGIYVQLAPAEHVLEGAEAEAAALDMVEGIAERWRDAEEAGAGELEDDFGSEGPNALLGAMADSLVLALLGDQALQGRTLPADEVVERIEGLEKEGAWGT